jgi:hypothetical protein
MPRKDVLVCGLAAVAALPSLADCLPPLAAGWTYSVQHRYRYIRSDSIVLVLINKLLDTIQRIPNSFWFVRKRLLRFMTFRICLILNTVGYGLNVQCFV